MGQFHFQLLIYFIYNLKFTLYLGTHNIRTCAGAWYMVSAAPYCDATGLMQGFSTDHRPKLSAPKTHLLFPKLPAFPPLSILRQCITSGLSLSFLLLTFSPPYMMPHACSIKIYRCLYFFSCQPAYCQLISQVQLLNLGVWKSLLLPCTIDISIPFFTFMN